MSYMTAYEFSKLISEKVKYGKELTLEQRKLAFNNKIVVAYGYSDNVISLSGYIENEVSPGKNVFYDENPLSQIEEDYNLSKNQISSLASLVSCGMRDPDFILETNDTVPWSIRVNKAHEVIPVYDGEDFYGEMIIFKLD